MYEECLWNIVVNIMGAELDKTTTSQNITTIHTQISHLKKKLSYKIGISKTLLAHHDAVHDVK